MCSPSMPEPPDPYETANAQTGTNINTAIANNKMGLVDQITPYGSLTYEAIYDTPSGASAAPDAPVTDTAAPVAPSAPSYSAGDMIGDRRITAIAGDKYYYNDGGILKSATLPTAPSGAAAPGVTGAGDSLVGGFDDIASQIPRYQATVELSPEQQAILDQRNAASLDLASLGAERAEFLKDYLPNADPAGIAKAIEGYITPRLDDRFAQDEEALRTRLAQQGLTQGTQAWDREMARLGQNKNDAYNRAMIDSYGTAISAINNPINQITALLSGGQVTNPNVQMSQPSQMPTVDQAGLINSNYNQQVQNYQTDSANRNSLLGGLFGLGSAGITGGLFI